LEKLLVESCGIFRDTSQAIFYLRHGGKAWDGWGLGLMGWEGMLGGEDSEGEGGEGGSKEGYSRGVWYWRGNVSLWFQIAVPCKQSGSDKGKWSKTAAPFLMQRLLRQHGGFHLGLLGPWRVIPLNLTSKIFFVTCMNWKQPIFLWLCPILIHII
jgi:hypothetical protein